MKKFISPFLALVFIGCGGGGGGSSSETLLTNSDKKTVTSSNKTVLMEDDFSKYQWHIEDKGIEVNRGGASSRTVGGNDMGLTTIWNSSSYGYLGYNNGTPIIVQVVDDGIDANHEDLKENIDLSSSFNDYTGKQGDPTARDPSDISKINLDASHGTQVAGLIGAIGYNNIGVKGVAPSAYLAGHTFKSNGSFFTIDASSLEKAWYLGPNFDNIAISNNSWGSCVDKDEEGGEIYLKRGAEGESGYPALRGGKGRIYLFAAGNGREGDNTCPNDSKTQNSNTSYYTNSQYSIAVAAVNNNHKVASYSSPGSNILVSGYSGTTSLFEPNMGTTVPSNSNQGKNFDGSVYGNYKTWSIDTKGNYTHTFNGTSAATPVVAGAIALVLEACKDLTYRDVKYLIAKTAIKIDDTYITNKAGLSHSNNSGFGLINIKGMIDECKGSSFSLLGPRKTTTASNSSLTAITNTTITKDITISQDMKIEWLGLTVTTDYDALEDLEIKLVSPSGTESILLQTDNALGNKNTTGGGISGAQVKNLFSSGFRLSSVAFMGESSTNGSSSGVWQVNITSSDDSAKGDIKNLSLEIVGH